MSKILTEEAFCEKYNIYSNMIFRVAYNYVHNRMDAEDITQNVFVKYYYNKIDFKSENDEKYWLIRITINESLNCLKKASKKYEIKDIDMNMFKKEESYTNNDLEKLSSLVDLLPTNYKNVIILYYYQNFSVTDISTTLGISVANVKKRLERARNILRKGMKEDE